MDDSMEEIVEVVPLDNVARLKELRGYVPFLKNILKTEKSSMTPVQYKKLNKLVGILEIEMTPEQFLARFSNKKLMKIETVVYQLKLKFAPRKSKKVQPNTLTTVKQAKTSTVDDFDRRVNPERPSSLSLTSAPATAAESVIDFERCLLVDNEQLDNLLLSPTLTVSSDGDSSPNAPDDSVLFSRRSKPLLVTTAAEATITTAEKVATPTKTAAAETNTTTESFERVYNSSSPIANIIKDTSFIEARKKLAATANLNDPRVRKNFPNSIITTTIATPTPVTLVPDCSSNTNICSHSINNSPIKDFNKPQNFEGDRERFANGYSYNGYEESTSQEPGWQTTNNFYGCYIGNNKNPNVVSSSSINNNFYSLNNNNGMGNNININKKYNADFNNNRFASNISKRQNNYVPRTYREHRLAKKQKQLQLEANENKRKWLEAEEKRKLAEEQLQVVEKLIERKVNKNDKVDKVNRKESDNTKFAKKNDKEKKTEATVDTNKSLSNQVKSKDTDKPKDSKDKYNVENQPPPTLVDNSTAEQTEMLSEEDDMELTVEPSATLEKDQEKKVEGKDVEEKLLSAEKPKEFPKLSKIKVVLEPIPHAMLVIPGSVISSNAINLGFESLALNSEIREPEFKRLVQRRKSIISVSGRSLVTEEPSTSSSALSADTVLKRQRGRPRGTNQQKPNADPLLKRKRGRPSVTKQQKSNADPLLKRKRGRPSGTKQQKPTADPALKKKRGRPPGTNQHKRWCELNNEIGINVEKDASDDSTKKREESVAPTVSSYDTNPDNIPTSTTLTNAPIPIATFAPMRSSRRSEVEKLNDDIAQMYYADDVLRATGRRKCTLRQEPDDKISSQSNSINVNRSRTNFKSKLCQVHVKRKSTVKMNKNKGAKIKKQGKKVLKKTVKLEPPEVLQEEEQTEEAMNHMQILGMPPTLPDEEQLLVLNEWKFEPAEDVQMESVELKSSVDATNADSILDTIVPIVDQPVNWNDSCTNYNLPASEIPVQPIINEELSHTIMQHLDYSVKSELSSPHEEVSFPPEPVLPRQLLRRFIDEPETQPETQPHPETQPIPQPPPSSPQHINTNSADFPEVPHFRFSGTVSPSSVISHTQELGLAISQVYSMADVSTPRQIVSLPPVQNDDFMIRQSVTQNIDGPISSEINILIEPRPSPESSTNTTTVYSRLDSHNHVGEDINDYVRHGVIDHGLSNYSELQDEAPTTARSQHIRNINHQELSTAVSLSTVSEDPVEVQETALTSQSERSASILTVLKELLHNTGYDDTKLYGCPIKRCTSCLTEETFINHVQYHLGNDSSGSTLGCKHCFRTFERPATLRLHLQHMHGRHKYFCNICLETTFDSQLMCQHMHSRHKEEFQKTNGQQDFLDLTVYHQELRGNKYWVSAMEQPFGQEQMKIFIDRLMAEFHLRRSSRKWIFRPSELGLLNRRSVFPKELKCGECGIMFRIFEAFKKHLMDHKLESIRLAYLAEVHLPSSFTPDEPIVPVPAKVQKPGKQMVVQPYLKYVPKEFRFICSVLDCGLHLSTEQELHKHLTTKHKHSDTIVCVHCHFYDKNLGIDKYFEHLSKHKRYVYQCGACPTFHPKRLNIDQHIQKEHAALDVDVIIHQRNDLSIHTNETEARWFKSVGPLRTIEDELSCNFCLLVLNTEQQMLDHVKFAHQRSKQYCCPYCTDCAWDFIKLIHHIRQTHPGKRPHPPIQCYFRIKNRSPHNLGFICNSCHVASNNFQQMSGHCDYVHHNQYQYKCFHCDFGNAKERSVINHMNNMHNGLPGLVIQQFTRLTNELLDSDFWNLAKPIVPMEKSKDEPFTIPSISSTIATKSFPLTEESNLNVSELSSSSDTENLTNGFGAQKRYEFACSHCKLHYSDVHELKSKHWNIKHAEQPFYFCVQPLMCCPACHKYRGSAKSLLEDHLTYNHQIRTLVACDIENVRQCAYCDYEYMELTDLQEHMRTEKHLETDLKNLTDEELNGLLRMDTSKNEYYQCIACNTIMPNIVAIAQHGTVEHNNGPFCFRLLSGAIIYHCSFCMYASTVEMETLRHMLLHYKKFSQCQFCNAQLNNGFEEYIQHCYTFHREDVKHFPQFHPYEEFQKFLMLVLYQFQNGLVISKRSLRKTRFNHESLMAQLYSDLLCKSQVTPISLVANSKFSNRITSRPAPASEPSVRRPYRRMTLNPSMIQVPTVPQPMVNYHTSFTSSIAHPVSITNADPLASAPTSFTTRTAPQLLAISQRILKRRSTYVEPGQLTSALQSGNSKRHSPP